MSLLAIRDLALSVGGTPILSGVSLALEAGEILGLAGESGSGKSLTALSVARLLPPGAVASGSVRLSGQELTGLSERAMCGVRGRDLALVFQEPATALNPVRTIGEQVAETLLIHGAATRGAAMRAAREALDRVGLPGDAFPPGRFPHELSGGQRQRVAIAMAIALHPKLLIADEPTTALDVTTQAQIVGLLRELVAERGMGLLLISHDLAMLADVADRIAVMQAGRIVEEGRPAALLARPAHPCTQALFAAAGHRPDRTPLARPEPLLTVAGARRVWRGPRRGLIGPPRLTEAVKGASLTLHEGESLGLVGESGSGKSTLARAILGLEPLDSGTVTMEGQPIRPGRATPNATRRHLQAVFQDPAGSFNPRHRVRRILAEPFHLLGGPPVDADARIADALREVGLQPGHADRFIHAFSGGERQRIAIARALIIRPRAIVLDEAVSSLDLAVRAQILDLLAGLQRDHGLAYLFIGHDLGVIRAVTDRVLVMRAGEIVEDGPTEEVFRAPRHPYTQSLIAALPRLVVGGTG